MSFNPAIWHVKLMGIDDEEYCEQAIQNHQQVRHFLCHLVKHEMNKNKN